MPDVWTSCICGHAFEEHGHDPKYPGSTACTECSCIAFETDVYAQFAELLVRRKDAQSEE